MNARAWLGTTVALGLLGTGCLTNDSAEITAEQEAAALAEALLAEVDFEGGTVIDSDLPDATADGVVISPVGDNVLVSPGKTSIMAIEVDNADEADDPVQATLIHVQNGKGHVEVPAMHKTAGGVMRDLGTGEGTADPATADAGKVLVENHFSAKAGICDNLCDKIFATNVSEVAKLKGGGIGRHHQRRLVLDCRQHGRRARCTNDDGDDIPADTLAEMMTDTVADGTPDAGDAVDVALSACAENLVSLAADVPGECAQCLCDRDENAVTECDNACWAALTCATTTCPDNDPACIMSRCAGAFVGADQATVTAVGDAATQCADMCPTLERMDTGSPTLDGGVAHASCEDVAVPGTPPECAACVCNSDPANASMCDDACVGLIQCTASCAGDQACVLSQCSDLLAVVGDTTAATAVGMLMATTCNATCNADADADADAGL